jgi:hypothetical protein
LGIQSLFVGIPSPQEAASNEDLVTKYNQVFKDLSWTCPKNLTQEDYDGMSTSNHFDNSGHEKYADFLLKLLDKQKDANGK